MSIRMMKLERIDDTHWFEKFTSLIEQNILGVKLGIYGVGFLGLGIALRSVRPFKKFKLPTEIPQSFIDSSVKLSGTVLRIQISPKTLLLVDHKPIFARSLRKPGQLPVNIEGITITGNGVSWLQTLVVGTHIDFVVLCKQPDCVNCLVYQKERNIGKHLVSIGFASVAPFNESLESNKNYTNYYKSLLQSEDLAEEKGAGMWWDKPRKFSLFDFLISKFPVLKLKTVFNKS